jgi:hypothetical protein
MVVAYEYSIQHAVNLPWREGAVHGDLFPDTVIDEEDAFETDDEPMESDADDSFDEEDVSEEEEVMEDEGGSLGRRLGLYTCDEVGRVLARRSRRARRRRGARRE